MTTPTTTPTEESPEAMEALFNELSQARIDGEPLPDAPSEKSDPAPELAAAPAPAPAPAIEAPIGAVDATAAPAPAPTPALTPAPAPAASAIDTSKLDKGTREYIEKIENERRAAIGRAASLQREQDAAKRRHAAAPAPTPAPAAGDDPSTKLATEFPELAAALKAEIAHTERAFNGKLEQATFTAKKEVLDGLFPEWLETMKSPEFNYWLAQQDEQTQKRFDSDSTRDYAVLLRSYEIASAPADAPPPPSDVQRIKQEREARLSRTANLPHAKAAPNPTGEPDADSDPEGHFNWLVKQREKRAARQHR